MKNLEKDNSHIEHIKPESLCRADNPGSDLDYENLVACFPAAGMPRRYRYGAQEKNDWWEDDGKDFISPLRHVCENRFSFDIKGNIKAVNGFYAAERTIQILGLDHPTLTEDRRGAIEEFIYGEQRDEPLSFSQASRAIEVICQRDVRHRFHEFCTAIRDALVEHVSAICKQARKRRFARAQMKNRKIKRP
jgi:uncharacterized protein (TIGR02646 family)